MSEENLLGLEKHELSTIGQQAPAAGALQQSTIVQPKLQQAQPPTGAAGALQAGVSQAGVSQAGVSQAGVSPQLYNKPPLTLNIEFNAPATYKIVDTGGHTVSRKSVNECFVYTPPTTIEDSSNAVFNQTMRNNILTRAYSNTANKFRNRNVTQTDFHNNDNKNPLAAGGKLKTKKHRKTKKRNQKRGFGSRSNKIKR